MVVVYWGITSSVGTINLGFIVTYPGKPKFPLKWWAEAVLT